MATRLLARSSALAVIATAIGFLSFASASLADTGSVYFDANNNAAAGETNLLFNATFTGTDNVGLGRSVMPNLTDGVSNVATGSLALDHNTTGDNNVASGTAALLFNTSGDFNTATGASSLLSNSSGSKNLATGFGALNSNTTGEGNVAAGYSALHSNSTGARNVAAGIRALDANKTGKINVAVGRLALSANTTGNANVAIGANAGKKLTTGSHNIDIANVGKAGEAGTIRIGNDHKQTAAFLAGVAGTTVSGAAQPVLVNAKGQLGTAAAAKASESNAGSDGAIGRLRARNRRQDAEIDRQATQIATLEREVRRLSQR
jgi:hypothetical protein